METCKQCPVCHKTWEFKDFMRKNYKGTGNFREWKVCNRCILKNLKAKVSKMNKEYNIAYNYISPISDNA